MKGRLLSLALLFLQPLAFSPPQSNETFDVLIRNGTLVDGTGKRGIKADL